MATTIKLRNSVVKDKAPLPSEIAIGEVCVGAHNESPMLIFKDNADNIIKLKPGGSVDSGDTPPISGNEEGDLFWDGDNLLVWNGADWEVVGGKVTSVNGEDGDVEITVGKLTDVTLNPLNNGDIITWQGDKWINSAAPPADISGSSIGDLNDVDTTGASGNDGWMLYWNDSAGEWQAAEAPKGTDLTGYLKEGDAISKLDNDAEYVTKSELPDIPDGALVFKGSIDATSDYPGEVKTGDVWSNTGTGSPRAEWGLAEDAAPGDLIGRGETSWVYLGKVQEPELDDYIKKGESITLLNNDAVYLKTTEKAADSAKLDGQEGTYYLNYQNLTNTPKLDELDYVPLGSWAAIPALPTVRKRPLLEKING